MPPVRPPIPYVPPTYLLKKRETKQIKVELPDVTKFQMPTFGCGNTKDYLVHSIAILRLVEQKGTAVEVQEAFAALVAVRKEMSPFFNFPEDKTVATKKQERRSPTSLTNPSRPRNHCCQTGPEGLQAFLLLCCWQGANAIGQNCEQNAHKKPLNWREWQIQQGDLHEILDFIHGLH